MQQTTIYEKSLSLANPSNPLQRIVTSVVLYATHYYQLPQVQNFVKDFFHHPSICTNLHLVLTALDVLNEDLMRQVVYGPNAYHTTPADLPHRDHLNEKFICSLSSMKVDYKQEEIKECLIENKLENLIGLEEVEELLWYDRERLMKMEAFIFPKISTQVLEQLEKNGENWNKSTPYPTLLLLLQKIYDWLCQNEKEKVPKQIYLCIGRLNFLHNKILHFPSNELAVKILQSYKTYFKMLREEKQIEMNKYIGVLVEYGYVLVFYYKYNQCQEIARYCKDLTQLEIEFSGKLGRRTKYQSFDTPQLVMNIKQKQKEEMIQVKKDQIEEEEKEESLNLPTAMQIVKKQINKGKYHEDSNSLKLVGYDEESILLDKPKFVEEEPEQNKVNFEKILVTLSCIWYMWDTTPKDEILYQQVSTSIATILASSDQLPYPITFSVLLLRSLNQFHRIKHADRAIEQLDKMKDSFNGKTQKSSEFLFSTAYYPHFEFIRILAEKYMEMGLSMSAVELFQKVGMVEDCIDGLISKNYKEKALELAEKCLKENGKTPRLLCMFGDLNQKGVQLYEEAWELSKNKYSRAQRSIGWYYFGKKQYEKAAEAFSLATKANHYHPNTWFTLGCSLMRINQFEKAAKAFGECVCIDDSQGQAWGNLAACYMNMKKMNEAYSTLEQGVRYSQRNWKMWSNLMSVALSIKKFYKYFQCIERIVELGQKQAITGDILGKIVMIFQYKQDTCDQKWSVFTMKKRIDRLYQFLIEKMGESPVVWESICEFNIELYSYAEALYNHYIKLYNEDKINKNDVLEGYESAQLTKNTTNLALYSARENIVESKQNELNMIMKVGWDENKMQCQRVVQKLRQYMEIYTKYKVKEKKEQENDYRLFVEGVRKKAEKCLEREIVL